MGLIMIVEGIGRGERGRSSTIGSAKAGIAGSSRSGGGADGSG